MTRYEKALDLWRSKNPRTAAELEAAMNGQIVSIAYNSGKIENENITYHDTREIFDRDGVTSYTGDLRTLFEIRNARYAMEFFIDSFGKKHPLDENFIKALHKKLTLNTYDERRYQLGERPGTYKINDYVTGKDEVGALPEDVPEEMGELIDELSGITNNDALTAAAYFHAKFENIHPFADGNGRTGRLAMNYFLVIHEHPPIVIHEEDRRAYYDALSKWDQEQDLDPLKKFLITQTEKTWEKQIARIEKRTSR